MRNRRWRTAVLFTGLTILAAAGLFQRWSAVNPDSLWLDDLWVAALARFGHLSYIVFGTVPCPGFVLLQRCLGSLLGWGNWQLQVLPLTAALLQVVMIGWFVSRMTGRVSLGLTAGALLVANPTLAIYSVRAKPFSIDGLFVLVIFCLAVACEKRRSLKLLALLAAVSVIGMFLSFPSIVFSAVVINILSLRLFCGDVALSRKRAVAMVAGTYDFCVLALYAVVLANQEVGPVRDYWSDFYMPLSSLSQAYDFMVRHGAGFFWGAFPARLTWVAIFVPVGLVSLVLDRTTRSVGAAVAVFLVAVVALSGLKLYPMGGGRTDIFAYPVSVGLAVIGIAWVTRRYRFLAWVTAFLALAAFVFDLFTIRYSYPVSGDRAVVERANAAWRTGDGVIVHPCSNWAMGYYGRWPARMIEVPGTSNGFLMQPQNGDCLVLIEPYIGLSHTASYASLRRQLDPFLGRNYRRILYVASNREHMELDPHRYTIEAVLSAGYAIQVDKTEGPAQFLVFERP